MISVPAAVRIFVNAVPTDMRKSFDGLHAIVTNEFTMDVMSGDYFVFFNRALDRCKVLTWDRDGLVVWAKKEEAEYTHFFIFTEVGGTHSLSVFVTPTRQMGRRKRRRSTRRKEMPAKQIRIDPPRAQGHRIKASAKH